MARRPKPRETTIIRVLEARAGEALERLRGEAWPNPKYARDPVGFVREVLKESPLPHQCAILEAARDNFKVAVRSGQKTGKTKLVIWLALWWYCTRADGKIFMLAAIAAQVDRVLWTELKATLRAAKGAGFELFEAVPKNPATGVIALDGSARQIRGITVRDIEALAGISGDVLFIVDEASHMPAAIAEAVEGNLAGDGKMIWISNPTKTDGPFYDCFNNPDVAAYWKTFHLSSEDVADYQYTHGLSIPGLATRVRIEEWAKEKGRESDFYVMRVLGEFLKNETGRIISLGDLELAQAAWPDASEEGGLYIGVDPAGPGHGGDEYAFCVRRGKKVIWLEALPGLEERAAIDKIRGLVATFRRGEEIPWVIADTEGPIGASLGGALHNISESLLSKRPSEAFHFLGVKASHNAKREATQYERVREELWASGVAWLRNGGALLPDHKLETELHAPMWLQTVGGKLKVTPKDELRDALGRSTDRADAFLLSVWEPVVYVVGPRAPDISPERVGATSHEQGSGGMDPYAGGHGRGGGFDPYR